MARKPFLRLQNQPHIGPQKTFKHTECDDSTDRKQVMRTAKIIVPTKKCTHMLPLSKLSTKCTSTHSTSRQFHVQPNNIQCKFSKNSNPFTLFRPPNSNPQISIYPQHLFSPALISSTSTHKRVPIARRWVDRGGYMDEKGTLGK